MGLEELSKRLYSLEKRVAILECKIGDDLNAMESCEVLAARYGQSVSKSEAARIVGVARVTVYAMIEDGRLEACCYGRRVSVSSIAKYLYQKKINETEGSDEHG